MIYRTGVKRLVLEEGTAMIGFGPGPPDFTLKDQLGN
jgi:hypothetical protein